MKLFEWIFERLYTSGGLLASGLVFLHMIRKRKLRLHWTCSDYTKHYHRWRWTAWLCGRIQYYTRGFYGKH